MIPCFSAWESVKIGPIGFAMTNIQSHINIYVNSGALSRAGAELFVRASRKALEARGRFLAAISGGGTPAGLFGLLADITYREQVPWESTYAFWADERMLSPDEEGSNYRQAADTLLDHVTIPKGNILRIKGELEPAEAVNDYTKVLKRFAAPPLAWPRFDLVLLGMGSDGHTASLFPGSPVETDSPVLSVSADYQGRPTQRVTLTPPVFNSAREVIFLVTGESKAETLTRVINGEFQPELLPAQRIRPADGELTWLLDCAAASKL